MKPVDNHTPSDTSGSVLDQLYAQAGAVGGMLDQVHKEMAQTREQLTARDTELATALKHAEDTDDDEALKEIRAEQDQNAAAWQVLREHLGDADDA